MKSLSCRGMWRAGARAPKASSITVVVALLFPPGASAAEYFVSSLAELQAAVTAANADPDATATIKLSADVTLPGGVWGSGVPTKPITIDTNGFVLTKDNTLGNFNTSATQPLTFVGTFAGASGAAPTNAMLLNGGGLAINNGTVTGGSSTVAGTGGALAISLVGSTDLVNNGTIKGGSATGTATNGGIGVQVGVNGSVVNTAGGLIAGGDANGGPGGTGVSLGASVNGSLVNQGTIRGGADLSGDSSGGRGVLLTNGTASINNSGHIEAGAGNVAIAVTGAAASLTVVNSGTIRAGTGYANAIEFSTGTGRATLELQAGSNIVGNVVANATGTNDAFRLGGSTGSVFDVSTIGDAAQYRYFDTFTKTGTSTWALIGASTVAAPWTVDQGTLQIGNGGTSGSLAGNVALNTDATLAFDRADAYIYSGVVSGAGGLAQNGTGTTTLTAASTYTGPTTVNLGTLAIEGSITSPVTVAAAGTLAGTGTVFGNVINSGMVAAGNSAGWGALTIAGNYIGSGGAVRVSAVLGDDSSSTGRLVVTGDTSGTGVVRVTNVGGTGAMTSDGIKIIDVQGASNATFTLAGDYTFQGQQAVVAGAYAYRLARNGVSTADGGWYLRSSLTDATAPAGGVSASASTPLYAPTVPLYEAYASVLQRFNELGTLQQRVGNRSWSPNAAVPAEQEAGKPFVGRGAWARVEGSNTHIDPSASTTSASHDVRMWKFEGGVDMPVVENQSGTLVVGPTFHYGIANSNVYSMFGNGAVDTTGYGVGATATWYGNNGTYVDARATVTWYDTDIRSSTLGTKLVNSNRGNGVATSVEAGHQLPLGGNWSVTPQAQLAWSQVRFDTFTDQYGAEVSRDNGNGLVSRLGVSLDHETKTVAANGKTRRAHVYGITNLYYDFLNGSASRVSGLSVVSKEQALWAGLGVGASVNWDDDRYTVYGEVLARSSLQDLGDSNAIGAKLGARYRW